MGEMWEGRVTGVGELLTPRAWLKSDWSLSFSVSCALALCLERRSMLSRHICTIALAPGPARKYTTPVLSSLPRPPW